MSFKKGVAVVLLCLLVSLFVMRSSGLNDDLGVSFLDVLAIIPGWLYGAITLFVVEELLLTISSTDGFTRYS